MSSVLVYVKMGFPRIPFDIHINQLIIATILVRRFCITSEQYWTNHGSGFKDGCQVCKSVRLSFFRILIVTLIVIFIVMDAFICLYLAML